MKNEKRFNFSIEGKDYELLRKRALADDRSIASYLRKIIKKVVKEQEEKNGNSN